MKPLTILTEMLAVDETGDVWYKSGEDEYTKLDEITMSLEKAREDEVNRIFNESLINDGDMIYVRKVNGAMQWLKANVMGVGTKGENWKELSPEIRKSLGLSTTVDETPLAVVEEIAVQEPEQYENGWYQDAKGNLHQYLDGKWTSGAPSIDKLEYLG